MAHPLLARSNSESVVSMSQEDQSNDPVRLARDHWVARQTAVSDSSEIIDSIDVDMVDASQSEIATEIYLVLDTNVLIHHLTVLKEAIACIEADASRLNVVMLVPGIVVSELDYQKNATRNIAVDSRRASDWLAGGIGSGKGRVKGQAYTQTMLPSGDWRQRNGLSNDELILDCCKYFGHIKRKDVLLCTSDNNLVVQASANAINLFIRGVSGVIRPPYKHWNSGRLLERVVPGFSESTAASMHASDLPPRQRLAQTQRSIHSSSVLSTIPATSLNSVHIRDDDAGMEIDMDDMTLNVSLQDLSPRDRRDALHRQVAEQLEQHLRKLTGKAAGLQQYRREHESMYSPANAKFTGKLPLESDWSRVWCLRDCLKFVAKIIPPQRRSWSFGDGEASSLADFLGQPGEKGARPGREWAKHDWGRELLVVQRLAQGFEFEELDEHRMAEYEYAVMEVFAID